MNFIQFCIVHFMKKLIGILGICRLHVGNGRIYFV